MPGYVGLAVMVKVTGAGDMPGRPRIHADYAGLADRGAVHVPDDHRSVVVLPQDVGATIAVEVAGAFDVPDRAGVRFHSAALENGRAAQLPHRDGAVGVLP